MYATLLLSHTCSKANQIILHQQLTSISLFCNYGVLQLSETSRLQVIHNLNELKAYEELLSNTTKYWATLTLHSNITEEIVMKHKPL